MPIRYAITAISGSYPDSLISQLVENHDGVRKQVVIPAEAGIQKNKKNILQYTGFLLPQE